MSDWTNEGFDPFASPEETGSAFGPKNGDNDARRNRPYNNGTYGNGAYGGPYKNGGNRNGGWYGNGNSRYGNQAGQIGYRDGYNDGRNDRATGHSFRPTQDSNYQHGTDGYSSSMGSETQYKQDYRQSYLSGYQQGYGR